MSLLSGFNLTLKGFMMAYMSQEHKKIIGGQLKKIVPSGWAYSLSVVNHSTIVMTIKKAPTDLIAEYSAALTADYAARVKNDGHVEINAYHWAGKRDLLKTDFQKTITEIFAALNHDNHDNSDSQSDYYDVGHYVCLRLGTWEKPFTH